MIVWVLIFTPPPPPKNKFLLIYPLHLLALTERKKDRITTESDKGKVQLIALIRGMSMLAHRNGLIFI